jgi:hypothetical protein
MNVSGTHLENRVAVPHVKLCNAATALLDVLNNSNQSGAPALEFASHSLITTAFAGAVCRRHIRRIGVGAVSCHTHSNAVSSNHSPAARTTPITRFVSRHTGTH